MTDNNTKFRNLKKNTKQLFKVMFPHDLCHLRFIETLNFNLQVLKFDLGIAVHSPLAIEFPMKAKDIPKFERQNPTISLNLFGYEEKELFPLYSTKEKKEHHVNLLLISHG